MTHTPYVFPAVCAKVPWATRAHAQENLRAGKESGHYQPEHKVYYCLGCAHFHIGRTRYPISIKKRKSLPYNGKYHADEGNDKPEDLMTGNESCETHYADAENSNAKSHAL